MGLFDKKYCDVCGEKIGLFGNRKLQDGNLCKDCAKKLSPWFSERRQSTVAEIRAQLAYREENEKAVENFHATRAIGRDTMVILDENAGKFMVATQLQASSENPDVLDLTQVLGCSLDVKEYQHEVTRTGQDGKQESYNPPRYEYSCDFFIVISVNHPYFNEMRFRLNDSSVVVRDNGGFGGSFMQSFNPSGSAEYAEYQRMSNEIIGTLTKARETARQNGASASAPAAAAPVVAAPAAGAVKVPVRCPYCGAMTTPDEKGCCEFCGGTIG